MPNNNILIKSLKILGLSDQAILLYEVLINNGVQSISKLGSILGLPRLQIYKYLEELAQKDLILKESGKTKTFEIASPQKLQTMLKIQASQMAYLAQDLDQTIKQFELYKGRSAKKNLLVIGEQKFKNLYLELNQKAETEVLFLGNADSLEQFLEDNYIDFAITNRVKKNITHRVLCCNPSLSMSKRNEMHQKQSRIVKYLPSHIQTKIFINIHSDQAVLWNPLLAQATHIQDKAVTDFLRQIFEELWLE